MVSDNYMFISSISISSLCSVHGGCCVSFWINFQHLIRIKVCLVSTNMDTPTVEVSREGDWTFAEGCSVLFRKPSHLLWPLMAMMSSWWTVGTWTLSRNICCKRLKISVVMKSWTYHSWQHPDSVQSHGSVPLDKNVPSARHASMSEDEIDQVAKSRWSSHTEQQTHWAVRLFKVRFSEN